MMFRSVPSLSNTTPFQRLRPILKIALDCGADQPVSCNCIMIERSSSPSSRDSRTQSAADSRSSVCQSSKIDKSIFNVAFRTLAVPSSSLSDSGSDCSANDELDGVRALGDGPPREGPLGEDAELGPFPGGPFEGPLDGPLGGALDGPLVGPLVGPLDGPLEGAFLVGGGDWVLRLFLNGSGSSSSSSQSSSSSSSTS